MQLTDTRQGYGWISIAFHWLVAALVFYLFFNGLGLEEGDDGRERFARGAGAVGEGARRAGEAFARGGRDFVQSIFAPQSLHVTIGMIALILIVARIVWRMMQGSQPKANNSPALNVLAYVVQWGLLAALLVLVVTGPLMVWTRGQPIRVFDWFAIPSPLPSARSIGGVVREAHSFAANALIPLVGLHILGALKHAVIDRDGVLRRMLVAGRA